MKAEDWEELIMGVIENGPEGYTRHFVGNLAHYLEECDDAKQILRDKGYGWLGVDIRNTAWMVKEREESDE